MFFKDYLYAFRIAKKIKQARKEGLTFRLQFGKCLPIDDEPDLLYTPKKNQASHKGK